MPVKGKDLVELFESHGIMPTAQRLRIAEILFSQPQHLSADQVLARVNHDHSHVSKATVYNTLGLFASKGLVREVIVDPNRVFYDPTTHAHHHFFNADTGELMDIGADDIAISRIPTLPMGTVAEGVEVIVRLRNASADTR